ncbi:MAG: hypothetical protein Q8P20_00170 [bacterium]|nr:hypothetical protein [bacterium]
MKTPEEILSEWDRKKVFSKSHKELAIMAMEEYAKQYEDLLWDIINEREKAMSTEDLFAVLQKIEIAKDKIPVKPF